MEAFLGGDKGWSVASQYKNAVVTICIGDEYLHIWKTMCRPNWLTYCERFGFDLIVVIDHLDNSELSRSRSPSWQKLLVLEQTWARQYERILWMDADIIISRDAPNILDSVPDPGAVGICLSGGQMSEAEQHIYVERLYGLRIPPEIAQRNWLQHHQSCFEEVGIMQTRIPMYNGGLLVVSPFHHAFFLREIYCRNGDSRLYEQPFLSAALAAGKAVKVVSPRFNWSVHEAFLLHFLDRNRAITLDEILVFVRNEMNKAYFLHFAGSMPIMKWLFQSGNFLLEAEKAPLGELHSINSTPMPEKKTKIEFSTGDYVSPGLERIQPDSYFPNMVSGDPRTCSWQYLRPNSPHTWYIDKRLPGIGFLSRDEATLLYNTALKAAGKPALEIGCFMGWSACHLALAGVRLDIIDPLLSHVQVYESVSSSLQKAGVLERCNLIPGTSPDAVKVLATENGRRWNLIFIDGDHEGVAPQRDAEVCCNFAAADDCLVLFHDLYSPFVAEGLRFFKQRGWSVRIYNTTQIIGVAWRGEMRPIDHIPDPRLGTFLPAHLKDLIG